VKRQRGTIFILTLGVLAVLVGLLSEIAISEHESARAEINRMETERARLMAESAIQRAIAEIQGQDPAHANLSDPWAVLGDAGSTSFTLNGGSFRVQIVDAGSKININTAVQDQLSEVGLTDPQVQSLLDWREPGAGPRPLGAKDTFYNSLPVPYNAKLLPFDSVDELLLVNDFTPETLYSGSTEPLAEILTAESSSEDGDVNGNQKISVNSTSLQSLEGIGVTASVAQEILQAERQQQFTTFGAVFQLPGMDVASAKALADNATIATQQQRTGLINVNTASAPALESFGIDSSVAEAIVNRQSDPMKTLGELLDIPGVDIAALAKMIDGVCVSARSFEIRALGEAGTAHVPIEATVQLGDDGQVHMTRLQPQLYSDVKNRWSWPDTPTTTISLSVQ
jgi:general secretion pathway protein K